MNELFNVIKNSLRSNSFYIPSQNKFVNGSSLSIKQYNDLLELDATTDFGLEQSLRFSIITDNILTTNLESTENLLYFDKPFILIQIKMAQESNFLGFNLAEYKDGLKLKTETLSLSSYNTQYLSNNLAIDFGLNSFLDVSILNKTYYQILNGNYGNTTDILTLELFKYLKNISYHGQNIGDINNVTELKSLIEELPAGVIESFNNLFKRINTDVDRLNSFKIKNDDFVFNPTLEFMLM